MRRFGLALVFASAVAACATAQEPPSQEEAGVAPASDPTSPGEGRLARLYDVMSRADGDQDGVVTQAEMAALRATSFDRLDVDGDGFLAPEDLQRPRQRAGEGGGGRFARFGQRDPIAEMDANGDGRISRTEFVEATPRWFGRADADDNGAVSVAELDAFAERMERFLERRGGAAGE